MAEPKITHSDAAVALLRANLGFFSSDIPADLETYLFSLLDKASADFADVGIVLTPGSINDDFDQATYAAWLYRNGPVGSGKTELLKSIIRNRQVRQALTQEDLSE